MIPKGSDGNSQSPKCDGKMRPFLLGGLHPFKYYVQIRRLSALNISLNKTKQNKNNHQM